MFEHSNNRHAVLDSSGLSKNYRWRGMTDTKLPLVQVPIVDYGSAESDMASYREDGTNRALQLDNRGPNPLWR